MTTARTGTSFCSSEEGARNFFRDEIVNNFDSDDESLLTEQLARATSPVNTTSLSSKPGSPVDSNSNNDILLLKEYLNPWDPKNFGIFSNQFATGFSLYFFQTPIFFYMVDTLDASPSSQSLITGIMFVPWGLKIIFGTIVDIYADTALRLCGSMGRRKPFLFLGWLIFIASNMILASLNEPSLAMLALFIFIMSCAYIQADVANDALIVERSQACESEDERGSLQAKGYIIRFSGSVLGSIMGACLYNGDEWGWGLPIWGIFIVNALVPLIVVGPFFNSLQELPFNIINNNNIKNNSSNNNNNNNYIYNQIDQHDDNNNNTNKVTASERLREQWTMITELLQRRSVWQPCMFIFIYNSTLLTNPAWNTFLVDGLNFSNFALGLLTIIGSILSFLAVIIYKRYFFNSNWRNVYILCTIFYQVFSALQFILIFGLNKDIGMDSVGYEVFFAMSSYGMIQFLSAVQFLPACRLYLAVCPKGSEGTAYSLLTSLANIASTLAYAIAAGLSNIWDVSNDTIEDGNYGGLWKLTLLCMVFVIPSLTLITYLHKNYEQTLVIHKKNEIDVNVGKIFISVVIVGILFVLSYTALSVV